MNGLLGNKHLCVCVCPVECRCVRSLPLRVVCRCVPVVCASRTSSRFQEHSVDDRALAPTLSHTDFYLNKPKDGGRYGMDGGVTDTTIHRPLIGNSDFKTKGRGAWAVRVRCRCAVGSTLRHENHLTAPKKSTNG